MKEQSNGVPAALPTLLRAVEAEQASGCAAAEAARVEAHRRWAAVAKPLGSLGLLEAAVEDAAALGQSAEVRFDTRAVLVLCADNGVVRQGVSQVDSTVTAVAARSIAAGRYGNIILADQELNLKAVIQKGTRMCPGQDCWNAASAQAPQTSLRGLP